MKLNSSYRYWRESEMHTKPVCRSLAILESRGLIEHTEGRTKGSGLLPFSVRVKGFGYICQPKGLHQFVKQLIAEGTS